MSVSRCMQALTTAPPLLSPQERLKYERSFALHALYSSQNSTPQEESQDGGHPNPNPNPNPSLPEQSQDGDHLREENRTSDASDRNDVDDSGAGTSRLVWAARAPGPEVLGVEMVPIDQRSRRQILLSRFKATVRPKGSGTPRDSAPLHRDSAVLAIASGGAAPHSTQLHSTQLHSAQSMSAVVRAAGQFTAAGPFTADNGCGRPPEHSRAAAPLWTVASPSRTAASSSTGHLGHFLGRPRSPSNGGSSYGTESELETNWPPPQTSRHAEAMTTTIPAQSPRLPPLVLPQSLHSPPSPSSTTSSTTSSPPQTPLSLARADALTRTLQAMGLEYKPPTALSWTAAQRACCNAQGAAPTAVCRSPH